ncbi:DUF2784 domain-containing protein [Dactylosporangium siamense]|uniref:DUF2784 domain-containing protein n=1 Tax=Dactylosporangium siamense TaxID=685454 RepID=A0A919PIZ3_9ACTN|nr:DUF2784 domain-containing protein [Dactylosporangium siamense]GIG44327.1 hypothetical protein Dsi01nite_023680 [Dactylosporangium siamense]
MYEVLASTVLVLHFCFLAYVVLGGFFAWRWPRALWPHLAAAAWGLAVVSIPLTCPLTLIEHWARRKAGESGVGRGFIDQYIEGVLYPERYTHLLQVLVGVLVVVSYVGIYVRRRKHRNTTTNSSSGSEEMSEPTATV